MKNNKNTVEMVNNKDFEVATNQLRKVYGDTWVDALNRNINAIKISTGLFDNYAADDADAFSPCSLACDSDCEHCEFAGRENEFVIREMVKKIGNVRRVMSNGKETPLYIYGELLNVALVLNEITGKQMKLMVEEARAMCNRMLEMEVPICYELVEKMLYIAAVLVNVDVNICLELRGDMHMEEKSKFQSVSAELQPVKSYVAEIHNQKEAISVVREFLEGRIAGEKNLETKEVFKIVHRRLAEPEDRLGKIESELFQAVETVCVRYSGKVLDILTEKINEEIKKKYTEKGAEVL